MKALKNSEIGLVIDSGYEICGASRSIAYEISKTSGCPVDALGLLDKTKCLCFPNQNKAPNVSEICSAVIKTLNKEE